MPYSRRAEILVPVPTGGRFHCRWCGAPKWGAPDKCLNTKCPGPTAAINQPLVRGGLHNVISVTSGSMDARHRKADLHSLHAPADGAYHPRRYMPKAVTPVADQIVKQAEELGIDWKKIVAYKPGFVWGGGTVLRVKAEIVAHEQVLAGVDPESIDNDTLRARVRAVYAERKIKELLADRDDGKMIETILQERDSFLHQIADLQEEVDALKELNNQLRHQSMEGRADTTLEAMNAAQVETIKSLQAEVMELRRERRAADGEPTTPTLSDRIKDAVESRLDELVEEAIRRALG